MPEVTKSKRSQTSPQLKNILLVDDDIDFIQYALSVSESFNILVTTCETLEEANGYLNKQNFDGYIIDLKLPDGSGFDIVETIRKREKKPIAVITGVYHDEESFRLLKDKHQVDFVLDKPVYRDQLEVLLHSMFRIPEGTEKNELSPEKTKKLKEYYENTISEKIAIIIKLVSGVRHHTDEDSLTALQKAVHKLGGSAGSYGYFSISKICKELEFDILKHIEKKKLPSEQWLDELKIFTQKIKYYFQFPEANISHILSPGTVDYGFRHTLYVIDTNEQLIELLEKEKNHYNLELIIERNPSEALQRLKEKDFNPRAVLVANYYPGFELTGFDIIKAVRGKEGYLPTNFGLIVDKEGFDIRMKATNNEIDHLFFRPTSPSLVLKTFANEITVPYIENFKTLILDDDKDFCLFVAEALQEIGIHTKIIMDPSELYQALEEFDPHLLILDVLLPKYNGLQVLRSLRSDPAYDNLAVLISTHFTNNMVNEVAFAKHALDVMYKPLDGGLLQKNVLELAKQLNVQGHFSPLQNRIGLKTISALSKDLQQILELESINNQYLVVFEIGHFDDFVIEQGKSFISDLFVAIGNLLLNSETIHRKPYFIEPSRFAILIDELSQKVVEDNVKEILLTARNESHQNITLSAGIIVLSKKYIHVQDVFLAVEHALNLLKNDESFAPVKIKTLTGDGDELTKREVLFVDPDQDLQKMIRSSLEPFGFETFCFSTGEDFLKALDEYEESHLPALIISERKILDMDGMELLDKTKHRFRHHVPFYFLTSYSSDQDIKESLQHGVTEYITKPFNLSILLQKILGTVTSHKRTVRGYKTYG